MSGKKYKIYQGTQFLGHHCATSAAQAVEKMLKTMYASVYNVDSNGCFDVYYGSDYFQVYCE